jgi:hypothetical protein
MPKAICRRFRQPLAPVYPGQHGHSGDLGADA